MHSISRLSRVPAVIALSALCALARPVAESDTRLLLAQGPVSDPYGIESPAETAPPAALEDAPPAAPAVSPAPVDTAPVPAVAAPADTAPRAPRPRITRETTINPMDVKRGSYRNPKKALFMSLVVPGLGQAYIGQSTFTYARGAAYFATDVTLGLLWYNYSVVKYDRQVKNYRAFANEHWSQKQYEDSVASFAANVSDVFIFERLNPARGAYCNAVQASNTITGAKYLAACSEPYNDAIVGDYEAFRTTFGDDPVADRPTRRAGFPDPVSFYELIGANREFIFGWDDALGAGYAVTGSDTAVMGSSANRDIYNSMRQKAKDYSRMQTWFLGGIVLNHIASAVDAALTARRHNRILYQGEARWYDRVNLDGGLAFDEGRPRTQLTASLSF